MASTENPLGTILSPRSVVVAGAGTNPAKMGTLQAMNLLTGGFDGRVTFIHPKHAQVLGRPAVAAPSELADVPDLALLVTPAPVTVELLDGLGARGVRHAVICSAGFGEVGRRGEALTEELSAAAQRHGMRFVGPNCMGVLNTHAGFNLTLAPVVTEPGPLALVSQSGTFVAQTQFLFRDRGIRLSKAISIGNAYSIDMVDCLEYLAEDPDTKAIALYVEGVGRGRRFVEVAREITRRKPIVALYIGGTEAGARAGRSHTAALGGPDRLWSGLFEQAGIVRASTVEELFEWGWGMASMPLPKGRRVGILTHSGGPAACMADECERRGLEVPVFSDGLQAELRPSVPATGSVRNPVDLTFTLDSAGLTRSLPELLFASDEIDALLVHGLMDSGIARACAGVVGRFLPVQPDQLVRQLRLDLSRMVELPGETGKPLVASTFVWDDDAARDQLAAGVPLVPCPQSAARLLAAMVRAAEIRRRPAWSAPEGPQPPTAAPFGGGEGVLDEHASKQLLAAWGAPVPEERACESLDEAVEAAAALGWPVVLKGLVPGVAHKSEAGLVRLGLSEPDALRDAWMSMSAAAPPGFRGLVGPVLRGVRELAAGMSRVPGLGPVVMLGQGGVLAEAIGDATFRLAPLSRAEAEGMLDSLRGRARYSATRHLPAVDRGALADILLALSRLAVARDEVAEVDVNPLIVEGEGSEGGGRPLVADAMVRVVG